MPIINIMLPMCATTLNVNILVWQNDNGFKNVFQFDVHPTPSTKTPQVVVYSHILKISKMEQMMFCHIM